MKRKKLILLSSLLVSLSVAVVAVINMTNGLSFTNALSTTETHSFTLNHSNYVAGSAKYDDKNYYYNYQIKGTSKYHGDFFSLDSETTAYGNWAEENSVEFGGSDYIVKAQIASDDQWGSSAQICFGFEFKGITAVDSCTYTYLVNGEEQTGFAYIDGTKVYDYFANPENSSGYLILKDITISYTC